jgi:4-carboxymuconolactone decarboxylase
MHGCRSSSIRGDFCSRTLVSAMRHVSRTTREASAAHGADVHPVRVMRPPSRAAYGGAEPISANNTRRRIMAGSTSETPVLDLLASMTADSLSASDLDPETLMLVRIAALAAVDAPAVSYLLNLGAASDVGVDAEQVRGVLAAIAPIVGTARIASATGKIADALEVAIEVAELEEQEQEEG